MADLTHDQAITAARQLQREYGYHQEITRWRNQRARLVPPAFKALGIEAGLKDLVPYQSHLPGEEAQRFANAFHSATLEIAVYMQSEKQTDQDIGQRIEDFADAAAAVLLDDEYRVLLHMAAEGYGVMRLDLLPQWWKGAPAQGDDDAEGYGASLDGYRKAFGLPFEAVHVMPDVFFWEENKKGDIVHAVEVGERKESAILEAYKDAGKVKGDDAYLGPTVAEGEGYGQTMVKFIVVRCPGTIYHILLDSEKGATAKAGDRVLWEGPNIFAPSTGYFMWKGLPSGYAQPHEPYLPFILNTLNVMQHYNLVATLQADLMVQTIRNWTERDAPTGQPPMSIDRQMLLDAKDAGTTKRTEGGNVVAEFGTGEQVKYRDPPTELMREVGQRMDVEFQYGRFPESLAPSSDTSYSSAREYIRVKEASSQIIGQGYESRKRASRDMLGTVIRTIFDYKPFLADGGAVYVPHQLEGVGDEGTMRREDVIALTENEKRPFKLDLEVVTLSQAAQLALTEEGMKLLNGDPTTGGPVLPRDILDREYFGVKDPQVIERLRQKDAFRAGVLPVMQKRGIEDALATLEERRPAPQQIVVPENTEQGAGSNGLSPNVSAGPDVVQGEDVAGAMGSAMGGPMPSPQGGGY